MQNQAISSSAVSKDDLEIPLIDFSGFLTGDTKIKHQTAEAILSGFQRAGFIYLRNHGVARDTVRTVFAESARFFTRPQTQKDELSWTTPEANRGYSSPGREKTTTAQDVKEVEQIRAVEGADLKESFEIGRENEVGLPNHWPDRFDAQGKAFKETMVAFHEMCKGLHMQIMRAIAVGLGIPETWFDGFCDRGDNTLRLLHYPEVNAEVFRDNKNTVRAGAHSDYGSITCLFQVSRVVVIVIHRDVRPGAEYGIVLDGFGKKILN